MLAIHQHISCENKNVNDAADTAIAKTFHEETRQMEQVMQEEIQSVKEKIETIKAMGELGRRNYEKSVSTEPTDNSDPTYANETQYDSVDNWNGTTTHTQTTTHIENGEKTTMIEIWTTKSQNPSMFSWFIW